MTDINTSVPKILDPIIIDGIDSPLEVVVYKTLLNLKHRLFYAGFSHYRQAIVSSKLVKDYLKNYLLPYADLVSSNFVSPEIIYILTASGDNVLFIHPPYENGKMMSWDEYFLRISSGESLKMMIIAPWAQAKITGFEL